MKRIFLTLVFALGLSGAAFAQHTPSPAFPALTIANLPAGELVAGGGSTAHISGVQVSTGLSLAGGVLTNAGVLSFNGRTGTVTPTSGDVTGALGFVPAISGANADITSLSGLTTALPLAEGGTGATSASAARTALGLGSAATYAAGTSGGTVPLLNAANTWSGVQTLSTPLAIASGGTGASTAAAALTSLGAASATVAAQGQFKGTAAADNATAGNIGEYVSSNVSATMALTNGSAKTITSVSLTAGDWDVSGLVSFNPSSTTATQVGGGIGTTANALPSVPSDSGSFSSVGGSWSGSVQPSMWLPVSPARISVASTTTVYLIGYAVFSAGTMQVGGTLRARRVR